MAAKSFRIEGHLDANGKVYLLVDGKLSIPLPAGIDPDKVTPELAKEIVQGLQLELANAGQPRVLEQMVSYAKGKIGKDKKTKALDFDALVQDKEFQQYAQLKQAGIGKKDLPWVDWGAGLTKSLQEGAKRGEPGIPPLALRGGLAALEGSVAPLKLFIGKEGRQAVDRYGRIANEAIRRGTGEDPELTNLVGSLAGGFVPGKGAWELTGQWRNLMGRLAPRAATGGDRLDKALRYGTAAIPMYGTGAMVTGDPTWPVEALSGHKPWWQKGLGATLPLIDLWRGGQWQTPQMVAATKAAEAQRQGHFGRWLKSRFGKQQEDPLAAAPVIDDAAVVAAAKEGGNLDDILATTKKTKGGKIVKPAPTVAPASPESLEVPSFMQQAGPGLQPYVPDWMPPTPSIKDSPHWGYSDLTHIPRPGRTGWDPGSGRMLPAPGTRQLTPQQAEAWKQRQLPWRKPWRQPEQPAGPMQESPRWAYEDLSGVPIIRQGTIQPRGPLGKLKQRRKYGEVTEEDWWKFFLSGGE